MAEHRADAAPEGTLVRPGTADGGPVSYAIITLARVHGGYAGELLRGLGLHVGQELILMQLLERDHQSQSELLKALGMEHSTVSRSLRRMQEAGFVTRKPADRDRRVMIVSLTEKGKATREPLAQMLARLEKATVESLDEASRETFIALARAMECTITAHRGR
ncbi:MarR family winged helix-turn-helix transcriptional regulator [Streptomyces sp. NPDC058256]|uniref:MarR family winged helix-turn-helix transcriptional regulator n=1 Tax=Streptomyces sp. NPDC058256 TaxID=3346408 RepID=UPI0036ECADC5